MAETATEPTFDLTDPAVKKVLDAYAEEYAKGLKANEAKLKAEKQAETKARRDAEKQYQEILEQVGGEEGIERTRTVLSQIEEDEDKELWKQGRLGDLRGKWTRQVSEKGEGERVKLTKKLEDEAKRVTEEQKRAEAYRSKIADSAIASRVRAEIAKREHLFPTVADDALAVIRSSKLAAFDPDSEALTVYDDHGQERDGFDLGALIDELAEKRQHWVKPSAGGGATGGGSRAGSKATKADLAKTPGARLEFIRKNGQEAYSKLPEK